MYLSIVADQQVNFCLGKCKDDNLKAVMKVKTHHYINQDQND